MSNTAKLIIEKLRQYGFKNYVGVPCSMLKGIYQLLEANEKKDILYVPAVREDSAIGVASGIYLGGENCVVLMQNSGLGYSLNVLTSLNLIYKIPVLLVISWRGYDPNDAIEHKVIGEKLTDVLDAVEIPHFELEEVDIETSINRCMEAMEKSQKPVVLLVKNAIA